MYAFNKTLRGATDVISFIVGILLVAIVVCAVAIPVIQDVLIDAGLTGTVALVLSIIPTLLALVVLIIIGRGFGGG